jgi:hypothetical protein
MAKNYTLKEAANIIAEGKKKDEIMEIGKRFPLLAVSLSAVIAKANDSFLDFINYMPDHITANKINSAMKADIEDSDTDEDIEAAEAEAPASKPAKKTKKSEEAETESDYNAISGSKLYDMIKAAGKIKDLKAKGFGTKKADLVAYLEKFPLDSEDADDEDEAEAETETEESGKYDDMNAMELFKECKKRGIKAAPKKPAKFYVELLEKNDAENAEDEAEADENEDWDEEPEEKPAKPAKSEKKAEKKAKPAKKAEPKEEPEDDEDDDWDI